MQVKLSQRSAALLAGVISPRCCPLVLLGLRQPVRGRRLADCRVTLCLLLRLLVLSALSGRVSQPLLVEASEAVDVDQVVVPGFVLVGMKYNVRKQSMVLSFNFKSGSPMVAVEKMKQTANYSAGPVDSPGHSWEDTVLQIPAVE